MLFAFALKHRFAIIGNSYPIFENEYSEFFSPLYYPTQSAQQNNVKYTIRRINIV